MQLKQKGKASEISKTLHKIRRKLTTGLPMPPMDNMHRQFTLSQIHVMTVLVEKGSMTMRDLAVSSGVTTPSMTDMINRLVRQKEVLRFKDKEDRRIIHIRLTTKGINAIKRFHDMSGNALALLFDLLAIADQRKVLEGLKIMERLVSDDKSLSLLKKQKTKNNKKRRKV